MDYEVRWWCGDYALTCALVSADSLAEAMAAASENDCTGMATRIEVSAVLHDAACDSYEPLSVPGGAAP